jgi:hypothetical protein
MRTTLNLDDDLIQELMKATDARTKTEAIHQAISELIRRRKLEKLKSLSGQMPLALDLKKPKKIELKRQNNLIQRWHGNR